MIKSGAPWIALAAILWSLDGVLRTGLRRQLSPIDILFWEHFFAVLLLFVWIIFTRVSVNFKLALQHWKTFLFLGALSSVIATLFYTAALGQSYFIPISLVVLLQKLQPIWALLAARILLKEKFTTHFLAWALFALIGSFLISFPDLKVQWSLENPQTLAAVLGLSASGIWGVSTVIGRKFLSVFTPFQMTFWRLGWGLAFASCLIFVLPLGFEWQKTHLAFPLSHNLFTIQLSISTVFNILIIVFFTGLGALWIYYKGLKNTPARVATFVELLWPVSALLIDLFYDISTSTIGFRPDLLKRLQILGIMILLFSIHKITQADKKI